VQTERQGPAGPVRLPLGGRGSPAALFFSFPTLVQCQRLQPIPSDLAFRTHHQPAVKVSDEQAMLGNRFKTPVSLFGSIWRTIVVPQSFHPIWIQPWLNVAEPAPIDFHVRLHRGHVIQHFR